MSSGNTKGSSSQSESLSPQSIDLGKLRPINVKSENTDLLLPKSTDIKRQLSQSMQGGGSVQLHGGIVKPQSRKNSIITVKSDNASENEDGYDTGDLQALQGNERKRRDNINEKIQELLTLIPSELFEESSASIGQHTENEIALGASNKNPGTKDGRPNKGQILTKSIEYIQYLQNLIDENNRKEVELTLKLKNLEAQADGKRPDNQEMVEKTSAEKALSLIGVGPLADDYFKQVLVISANSNKNAQKRTSQSTSPR